MIIDEGLSIYTDFYAFVNYEPDLQSLLYSRKPSAIHIKEYIRERDKGIIVLQNTSKEIQFNVGLKSEKGNILDSYFTFMPEEIIGYTVEGITDIDSLSVF